MRIKQPCKNTGAATACLNKARRHLFNMAPGLGAELLLLIVIGGLALWML